jgi:hypothetical protein
LAQTYLTIQDITYEMLLVLHNNLIAGKKVTRTWEKKFAQKGAKIGATIDIRKPPRYTVTDGTAFVSQDYTEEFVPLTVDTFKQVGCEWANTDLTLSMDDFSGRFLKPALVPLANSVDIAILNNLMNQAWNATGTPGTTAATDTPFLDAKATLFNAAALITDDMPMLLTGKSSARLSSVIAARYNPQNVSSDAYLKGAMAGMMRGSKGNGMGWDFFEDQNMPTHTTGAFVGTPLVNGADQTGSNIITDGWTGTVVGILKKNDIIQFTGVYGVNPVTFLNTGELQNFRVTADTDSNAGAVTIPIEPAIILGGKNQTVTASPADNAPVIIWGTTTVANVASKVSPQNIGWQVDAVTLACVDLYVPEEGMGVKATRVSDEDLGLSFLFMSGFDMKTYSKLSRIDILFGTTATRPEQVIRVAN